MDEADKYLYKRIQIQYHEENDRVEIMHGRKLGHVGVTP